MSDENRCYANQKEIARILGRSPRYVAGLTRKKLIPCIELPGHDPLFEISKVRAALNKFSTAA